MGIRGKIVLTSALIAVLGVASVALLLTWQAADGLTATPTKKDVGVSSPLPITVSTL